MKRYRIGFICVVLFLAGCDHHQQASQTNSAGAAIAESDSAYTGVSPGAAPATSPYPRAVQVASVPAPSASPKANPTPSPKVSTPTVQSMPPRSPIPETTEPANATPAPMPGATQESVASPTVEPSPAADAHSEPGRLEVNPPNPPVVATPSLALTDTQAQKQVVVLATSLGRIVIELDDISAPRTCGNFRKLVSDGFYNHTVFHRVIPNFVIQGGDPNSKTDDRRSYGQGDPGYTLPAEIRLKHTAGAVAMARLPDALNPQRESNGSQFYICVANCPSLDNQYTVFAHVIQGMDVANKIANQPRDQRDNPTSRIEMEARLETKKQALEESGT